MARELTDDPQVKYASSFFQAFKDLRSAVKTLNKPMKHSQKISLTKLIADLLSLQDSASRNYARWAVVNILE